MSGSRLIGRLIESLRCLPGVGPKSAQRMAFHLLEYNRDGGRQLAEALSESGHGLLLYPEGLNTARNLAVREGVPAATLFRDFDAQDEDARVIRRFLDYAALKAGQEGGVVMVGRLRPDTVSALLVWGLADRASQVHLVPVSAVLTEQLPG